MIYALFIVLSVHVGLAATFSPSEHVPRTLAEGEAFALGAVFGTKNMPELLKMEADPAAYWEKRAKALQNETISHSEFCQTYTREAEWFLKTPMLHNVLAEKPWFYHNIEAIEATVTSKIPKDHPAYQTAVTFFTTCACDYLWKPHLFPWMATQESLAQNIDVFLKERGKLPADFYERLRWTRSKEEPSIFDHLIMMGNQEYLCHAITLRKKVGFEVDPAPNNTLNWVGLEEGDECCLTGFNDPIFFDALFYPQGQYSLQRCLRSYGLSQQHYFEQCWNKNGLIKNDIVCLAEQALGCFYQFRELPAFVDTWSSDNVHSCIFPDTEDFKDPRFLEIVPYFRPKDRGRLFNFRTDALEHVDMDASRVNSLLRCFRSKYCAKAGGALLKKPRHPAAAA